MGVLRCSRDGCENIMCDRHSPIYGYICNECFEELIFLGPETNTFGFMASSKKTIDVEAAKARFEVEFPLKNKI